jgi:hypothetical protein
LQLCNDRVREFESSTRTIGLIFFLRVTQIELTGVPRHQNRLSLNVT